MACCCCSGLGQLIRYIPASDTAFDSLTELNLGLSLVIHAP